MPKPPRPWTVLPHGPLERLEENLYAIEGAVPGIPGLRRRMAIVRRADGGLLFFNAVPVGEEALARITCPIGLPGVGGKSPAEIAIAVAAELLQLRGARRQASG